MASKTRSITSCNSTTSNIDANIVKRNDAKQEELLNYEDENNACKMLFVKGSKRIQQIKRPTKKKRKNLLVTDKGNAFYCVIYKFHIL